MQKYHAFVKLFYVDINNQMNAYKPRLYINYSTQYKKPSTYHAVMSTVP